MGTLRIISRSSQPFADRAEAGRLLARQLQSMGAATEGTVVLGIPRGGIILAFEIARARKADLDIVLSRKMRAPGNPELAIGAVSEDGKLFLNRELVERIGVGDKYIREEQARQMAEIARRSGLIRAVLPRVPLSGKDVIVTDDGIATGATMQAALRTVSQERPSRLIGAVPVGPEDTLMELARDADEFICLRSPPDFAAVGQFFRIFPQIEDEEVVAIMQEEASRKGLAGEKPRPV